jgi:polysaccharide export outer membrane protein
MQRYLTGILCFAVTFFTLMAGSAMAQAGYKIRSGDTLRFEVLEDSTLNRSVLVAPDGRISVPLIGGVAASGRTVEQVQSDLAGLLAPNFANTPNVYLALERQREIRPVAPSTPQPVVEPTINIFFVGEATKPGKVEMPVGTTVLQAFAEAGGFTRFAAVKRIQLRRGSQTMVLNYRDIERGESQNGGLTLTDGDVIVIPQRRLFE